MKRFLLKGLSITVCSLMLLTGCNNFKTNVSQSNDIVGEIPSYEENKTSSQSESGLQNATITFLDVGQADCSFLEFEGKTMLIDAGNRDDGELIASFIEDKGYDTIDFVIATHPHEDHIGGLPYVLDHFDVKSIYTPFIHPSCSPSTKIYNEFLTAVNDENTDVINPDIKDIIYQGEDTTITVLTDNKTTSFEDLNDYSIALKFEYGNNDFIFAGDATEHIEENILSNFSKDFLDVNVLKVSHHGSCTSNSSEWLSVLSPEYSVIMCGKNNKYNHPHQSTLDRLNTIKSEILRTDISGTITLYTDGKNIIIN